MRTAVILASLGLSLAVAACTKKPDPAPTPPPPPPPAEESNLGFKPATGTVQESAEAASKLGTVAEQARAKWQGKTFEEFRDSVYKEPFEGGKYIVSGDIPIEDEKQLREFFETSIQGGDGSDVGGRLIIVAGPDGTWSTERKKQLTYCVSNSFGPRQATVIEDMQAASQAWQAVADITFIHKSDQDGACTASNNDVVFDVRPIDVGGQYLARAFFPNESRAGRNVLIDETAFEISPTGNLQLVGILRHELGHALGFRHEHTRPESGTCFEDTDWVPMTSYDNLSAMHYPQCNGAGDWKLDLTAKDKSGAACAYGPAPGFTIDPSLVVGNCIAPVPPPPSPGTPETKTFTSQSVTKGEMKRYGPFAAKPGTTVIAKLTASGSTGGDADLYVRLGSPPERMFGRYNCRPYLSSSNETCELSARIPPRNNVHVAVDGFSAASFDLTVTFVPR
jgi:serine protease